MAAIALIGPDGSGKTTLTRMLQTSETARFKYIYMGIELSKSNVRLPTARWIERAKEGSRPRCPQPNGDVPASPRGGRARAWGRLLHRIADETYRQCVSWYYQARGFVVLYDRHFVFDFAPELAARPDDPADKRLHRWWLSRAYPRPTLVLFLDAPAELLFARKGELSVPELERRRRGYLAVGARIPGFVVVDATRPLAEVYADVLRHVERLSLGCAVSANVPS